jgi:hypothetical protein
VQEERILATDIAAAGQRVEHLDAALQGATECASSRSTTPRTTS